MTLYYFYVTARDLANEMQLSTRRDFYSYINWITRSDISIVIYQLSHR
jgi:hypothetical protein